MRRLPFHPFGFALFPVAFLLSRNAQRTGPEKAVPAIVAVLIFAAVCMIVATLVLRDRRRGAIAASAAVLLTLSYGHVWNALAGTKVLGFVIGRDLVLLSVWIAAGIGVLLLARRAKALDEITGIANALSIGLVAVAVVGAGTAFAARAGAPRFTRVGEASESVAADVSADGPDVYYLVFDRYGSREVLDEFLDFDNGPFVRELEERGFTVADQARSNYPTTAHSLASSLNLAYLDGFAKRNGRSEEDWRPLYKQMVGAKVPRMLQARGYRYVHIGNWWDPTAHDPTAQLNFHYDRSSEFTRVFVETTALRAVAKRFGFLSELDGRRVAHNQINFQFDSVVEASRMRVPTFTFAHLLLPHEPFTFYADGRFRSADAERNGEWRDSYLGQVRYANSKILATIDKIRAGPDGDKAVIVLQADEGPKPMEWDFGGRQRWEDATDAQLREKFGILTAVRAPGFEADIPDDVTPVNLWRQLTSELADTDLEPLPVRYSVYGRGDEPYRLTDVTKRLAR